MERHIATCEICRQELVEVAHLPGLLHRLTLDDVTRRTSERNLETEQPHLAPIEPQPLPEATTDSSSSWSGLVRQLSRSRALLLAAIMVLALVVGGAASAELLTSQTSQEGLTWTAMDSAGGIDTTAHLASEPWGTDIRLWMQGLPPGLTCRLVVHPRTGAAETAGWWSTNYEARVIVAGSTSIPLSNIDRIDVIRSDNIVLATLTNNTR
jgi:hypothetical protein